MNFTLSKDTPSIKMKATENKRFCLKIVSKYLQTESLYLCVLCCFTLQKYNTNTLLDILQIVFIGNNNNKSLYSSKDKNAYLLSFVTSKCKKFLKKLKSKNFSNLVHYIANSYLKTKRLINEFLKRIVLILELTSFLPKIVTGRFNTRHNT